MIREQILEMAKEARCDIAWADSLERFAALVAAAEREECAKVCESATMYLAQDRYQTAQNCAAAIRSMGATTTKCPHCREVYEVWAGSEGIPAPTIASEAYLLSLVEQMRDAAKKGLK